MYQRDKMGDLVYISIVLFIFVQTGGLVTGDVTPTEIYPNRIEISPGDRYWLFWKYDYESITFELHVRTMGWVGLGISPTGRMRDSDIFTAGVRNGHGYIQDRKAAGRVQPNIDESQDVTLLVARQTETHTIIKVRRPLKAREDQDRSIENGMVHMIWSYGSDDADSNNEITYHIRRGHISIELLGSQQTRVFTRAPPPPTTRPSAIRPSEDFPQKVELSPGDDYWLFWKHDYYTITFELHARTKGWVGLGISPSGRMPDSDIFTAGVRNGVGYVQDRKASGRHEPSVDRSKDVYLLSATETDTHTVVKVLRNIVTTDRQDINIQRGIIWVIWAYGLDDAVNNKIEYHVRRGFQQIQLISPFVQVETRTNLPTQTSPTPTSSTRKSTTKPTPVPTKSTTVEQSVPTLAPPPVPAPPPTRAPATPRRTPVPWPTWVPVTPPRRTPSPRPTWAPVTAVSYSTTPEIEIQPPTNPPDDSKTQIDPPTESQPPTQLPELETSRITFRRPEDYPTRYRDRTTSTPPVPVWPTAVSEVNPSEIFPYKKELQSNNRYWLFWKLDRWSITMEIHAATHGWVGLGFSTSGKMIGSDIITAGMDRVGRRYIQDRKAWGNFEPGVDNEQNVQLLSGMETRSHTVVKFRRSLQAENNEDNTIRSGYIWVIWAYGLEDAVGNSIQYHAQRGATYIQLIVPTPEASERYPHSQTLSPSYSLHWKRELDMVTLELIVHTLGWVAFGISPRGKMIGSDMFTGWIRNGQAYHQDRFARGRREPDVDPVQDWEVLQFAEKDDYTIFKIRRKIKANERGIDLDIPTGQKSFVWAYGADDPDEVMDNHIRYHGGSQRGVHQLEIVDGRYIPGLEQYSTSPNVYPWLITDKAVPQQNVPMVTQQPAPPVHGTKTTKTAFGYNGSTSPKMLTTTYKTVCDKEKAMQRAEIEYLKREIQVLESRIKNNADQCQSSSVLLTLLVFCHIMVYSLW